MKECSDCYLEDAFLDELWKGRENQFFTDITKRLKALAAVATAGQCSQVSGRRRPGSAGGCVNVRYREVMKMDPLNLAVDAAVWLVAAEEAPNTNDVGLEIRGERLSFWTRLNYYSINCSFSWWRILFLAVKWYVDIKQDFALDLEDFDPCRLLLVLLPQQLCSVIGSDPDWFSVRCGVVSLQGCLNCLHTLPGCCEILIFVVDKKTELLTLEGATINQAFSSTTQSKYFNTFQCIAGEHLKKKIPPTSNTEKRRG